MGISKRKSAASERARTEERFETLAHALLNDADRRIRQSIELTREKHFKDAVRVLDQAREGREQEQDLLELRHTIVALGLWDLVRRGLISWGGGKPQGSNPPIKVTPGPPISDWIIENRR